MKESDSTKRTRTCDILYQIFECIKNPIIVQVASQLSSDVNEVKSTEHLRQTGYDWTVASGVIVEFEEGCGHQLVVSRHGEEGLLRERDEEESLVLLGVGAVGRLVGILGGLKVGTPPIGHNLEGRKEREREKWKEWYQLLIIPLVYIP